MAAPTSAVQKLKKVLANGEPSTHGLFETMRSIEVTTSNKII